MKKLALVLTIVAVTAAGVQSASAGDREWATAGKILTGVVAGSIIANAVTHPEPAYGYTTVSHYYAPPVVYAPRVVVPAPVVVSHAPVTVCPPRVIVRPAPVISFNVGYGHYSHRPYNHYGHRGHYQVCR